MRITSGGNVGIGTSSPITKLSLGGYNGARLPYINGTGNTFDNSGITIPSSNNANAAIGGGIDLTNNTYSVGAYSPIISFSSLGVNSAYNNSYAGIWGVYQGAGGDSNWGKGDLAFGTALAFGINERMRITSGGNVGIGTTSPNNTLTVNAGAANKGIDLTINGTTTIARFGITDPNVNNNAYIGGFSNNDFLIYSNSAERMRITNGGALLINQSTSYHGAYLALNGKLHYSAVGGDIGGTIYSTWTQGSNGTEYYAGDLKFQYFTNKGSGYTLYDGMILDGAGRLGIGTNSPGTTLDISVAEASLRLTSTTGTNFTNQRIVNTGGTLWSGIERSTGGVLGITGAYEAFLLYGADNPMYIGTGNSFLRFGTNSTERMRITSGGNVEINTGSIKTGEPDTGWGRAAIKIGASVSGTAFNVTRYLPVSVDGTVYYINLNSSTP